MKHLTLILFLLLTSCTNTSFNQLTSDVNITVEANLNASIKVGEKITGNGSESSFLWIFRVPGIKYRASGNTSSLTSSNPATYSFMNFFNIVEHAKGEAIHDAITTSKADLIINPKFTIIENDYLLFKTIKCEVTGLKGTINKVQ
tara:strand:- start:1033 stop:1467 length:435 start_codon:yes stop_codon:yes gene_type:complete